MIVFITGCKHTKHVVPQVYENKIISKYKRAP